MELASRHHEYAMGVMNPSNKNDFYILAHVRINLIVDA